MNWFLQLTGCRFFFALALLATSSAAFGQLTSSPFGPGSQGAFSFVVRDGLTLTADLRLPTTAPVGVVVILHGGGGIGDLERDDERDLLAQGLATVVVDSFGGRNYRPPSGTGAGSAIRPAERSADAFAVLRALASHPDLKEKRAVLFGRSHGGSAAMVAATAWAKATYAPNGPAYAGYIALYPGCNASYPEQLASNAPLRLHVGMLDDLTPATPCETTVTRMKAAGVDVALTKYDRAHHAFDLQEPVRNFPDWISLRNCDLTLTSVPAPLPMAEIAKCVTKGAHMGGDRNATGEFRKVRHMEVKQLLEQ